jgi:hypothetical protein
MKNETIENEFNLFFEFNTADKSQVTSTSAKLFAKYIYEKYNNQLLPIESAPKDEQKMKHTKEPWKCEILKTLNTTSAWILGNNKVIFGVTSKKFKYNASRIVACVNACSGITNEQLDSGYIQKMIKYNNLLDEILDELDGNRDQYGHLCDKIERLK